MAIHTKLSAAMTVIVNVMRKKMRANRLICHGETKKTPMSSARTWFLSMNNNKRMMVYFVDEERLLSEKT